MDLPSIEITAYNVADNSLLNTAVKKQLLDVVSEIIDKNLT